MVRSEPADFPTGGGTGCDNAAVPPSPELPAPAPPLAGKNEHVPADPRDFRCRRCGVDLSRLATPARFCPRCGVSLSAAAVPSPVAPPAAPASPQPAHPAVEQRATPAAEWLRLREARAAPSRPPAGPQGESHTTHSLILVGYANAMYRLGWRYETGLGTGRNVEEAIRCYFKAAKLGNPAALARLAPQCAGGARGSVNPTPPAEPPREAS